VKVVKASPVACVFVHTGIHADVRAESQVLLRKSINPRDFYRTKRKSSLAINRKKEGHRLVWMSMSR